MMNKKNYSLQKQSGFSIVELMIAGLLGILLLGGVIQLFAGSNQNYSMQDELASIQEDGRFALMFLNNQIEIAGLAETDLQVQRPAINFDSSSEGGAGANDTIALESSMQINGISNIDCNGAAVADGLVVNQFAVNANNELTCLGTKSGGTAQPLISGVKSFQVLYGVESQSSCPDGTVNSYMTAKQVVDSGLKNKVMAVRVALLLEGEKDVGSVDLDKKYQLLEQSFDFKDKKARRVFQDTIYIRNAAAAFIDNDLKNNQGCQPASSS